MSPHPLSVFCGFCRTRHSLDQLRNQRRQVWNDIVIVGECPHNPASFSVEASKLAKVEALPADPSAP